MNCILIPIWLRTTTLDSNDFAFRLKMDAIISDDVRAILLLVGQLLDEQKIWKQLRHDMEE